MGCSVSCNSSLPSQSPYEVPGGCNEVSNIDLKDKLQIHIMPRSHCRRYFQQEHSTGKRDSECCTKFIYTLLGYGFAIEDSQNCFVSLKSM